MHIERWETNWDYLEDIEVLGEKLDKLNWKYFTEYKYIAGGKQISRITVVGQSLKAMEESGLFSMEVF